MARFLFHKRRSLQRYAWARNRNRAWAIALESAPRFGARRDHLPQEAFIAALRMGEE